MFLSVVWHSSYDNMRNSSMEWWGSIREVSEGTYVCRVLNQHSLVQGVTAFWGVRAGDLLSLGCPGRWGFWGGRGDQCGGLKGS